MEYATLSPHRTEFSSAETYGEVLCYFPVLNNGKLLLELTFIATSYGSIGSFIKREHVCILYLRIRIQTLLPYMY
jgi:hypothetical protein